MTSVFPTTYLSLHDVTSLKATTVRTIDAPLILYVDGEHGAMQISIYLREADTDRMQALADAINTVLAPPEPPQAACPIEAAAYAAHDILYRR